MSLTKVTNSMIDGAAVNVLDYGATGDGVTNDQAALQNAFQAAANEGKTLHIPAGDYLCNSRIAVSFTASTKGISVVCDKNARLIKSASFPNNIQLIILLASAGDQEVSWVGGVLDGRLAPVKLAGSAPDLMSINGGNGFFTKVYVSDVNFLSNDDLTGTAGDSCLFVAGCNNVSIVNNLFQGATDLGLYISGQTVTYIGERIYVAGNTFLDCVNAIGSKREYKDHIITGNFIRNTSTGIFIGGETEVENTAKRAVISNNVIQRCTRGIEARVCDGTVISGNRIQDYGISTAGAPVADGAIVISGSSNCIVSNNTALFSGDYTPNVNCAPVIFVDRTLDSTLYPSEYNLITSNIFNGGASGLVNYAVRETSGSASDYNVASNNVALNFALAYPYREEGANSNLEKFLFFRSTNPSLTLWDTNTGLDFFDVKIRLAETDGAGALDKYWDAKFGGTGTRFGLQFVYTGVNHFRVNGDAVSINVQPTTTPAIAAAGDVYYDSGTNKLRCYNGSTWNDLF